MVSHSEVKTRYGLKSWQRGITKINGGSKYLLTLNTSTTRYQDEINEGFVIYQMQKQKRKPIEKFGPTGNNRCILAAMESNGCVVQVDLAFGGKNQYNLTFGAYIHDITMKDGYPSFVIKIPSVPRNVMNAVQNKIAGYKTPEPNNRQLMLADDVLNFIRVDRSSVFTNLIRAVFGAVLKKFSCQRCGCTQNIQCAHAHYSRPQVIQEALALTPTVYINGLAFLDREVLKYQFIKLHAEERYTVIPLCQTCHGLYDKELKCKFLPPSL